jgi:hypothetical protein
MNEVVWKGERREKKGGNGREGMKQHRAASEKQAMIPLLLGIAPARTSKNK